MFRSILVQGLIFEVLAFGEPVGDGRTNSRYCTLEGVAKFGADGDAYVAANEYLSAFLGTCIGLPVPPCVLIRDPDGRLGTVSLRFGPAGERPPPVNLQHFASDYPQLTADVVAFDVWIHNGDRTRFNLAYSRAGPIPPAVFDHDQALFRIFPGRGKIHLEQHETDGLSNHVLAEHIPDGVPVGEAIRKIRSVSMQVISGVCDRLARAGAVSPQEAEAVLQFLRKRSAILEQLLKDLVHPLQPSLS